MQEVKFTTKEMKEEEDVEIIEIRLRREKTILMKKIGELKEFVRSLKMKNNKLKKDREERMDIHKKLHEELEALRVTNNELQKKCETVTGTELKMRTEMERVKIAYDKLNKFWESNMKVWEEEKKKTYRLESGT
jgi:hypothetical protein